MKNTHDNDKISLKQATNKAVSDCETIHKHLVEQLKDYHQRLRANAELHYKEFLLSKDQDLAIALEQKESYKKSSQ